MHAVSESGQTGRTIGSVSGVADCSIPVECDAVPDDSKDPVASILLSSPVELH
jgi:hypothetical protein